MIPKKVNFVEAVKLFFQNYANFKSRSSRSEFWWSVLFCSAVSAVLSFIKVGPTLYIPLGDFAFQYTYPILGLIFGLATLIPSLAITVRRLHDTGRSGLNILLGLIPLAGIIILIVFCASESGPENKWGKPYTANPQE